MVNTRRLVEAVFYLLLINRQIVKSYPRALELVQQLGWEIDVAYFYNNLRVKLGDTLNVRENWIRTNGYDNLLKGVDNNREAIISYCWKLGMILVIAL